MRHEVAGDPMTGLKWTRKTTQKISVELNRLKINVSANTVGRLLKQMGFSLKLNRKSIKSGIKNPPSPVDRNRQFANIKKLKEKFAKQKKPIISVDTKKKELIGNYKNNGQSWEQEPVPVKDHDFLQDAIGKAVPYGIYDVEANKGTVFLGTSYDTPSFAVDSIETWWRTEGQKRYSNADELLILADAGGSNSYRSRVWKAQIYEKICKPYGIFVKVCHYPPGTSKWNPIEHRLFSEISKNWAGKPLESFEKALKYIRTTKTSTGLTVKAHFVRKKYRKGESVTDEQMKQLPVETHKIMPKWNYTLLPSRM
ncbi:MAG: ISAzo13 family transposase [Desulfobacterales bacterium]|nr:ISAzo13 family transposase [Desulfobacterales bacterium]